jgi:hypothetical protein
MVSLENEFRESKVEKHFPVFGYVMENKMENSLLMFYFYFFSSLLK